MRDSGTEIDVVNNNLLLTLCIPHETIGKIALRLLVGSPISARLVKLCVRLVDSNDPSNQLDDYHDVIAAACDGIHNGVILLENTAQHLSDAYIRRVTLLNQNNSTTMEDYQTDHVNNVPDCHVNVITRSMHNKQMVNDISNNIDDINDCPFDQSSNLDPDADSNETFVNTDVINCELFVDKHGNINQLIDEQLCHVFTLWWANWA